MPGYRTIPSKDTFDVDEKLGGVVTVKQLAYLLVGLLITYFSFIISNELFEGSSDSIYVWGSVLFFSLLFAFGNIDKWVERRIKYYITSDHQKLERNPNLLANIKCEEENKLITLDGRVIAVLKVTPINFPLLSDEAKEAKIAAYETYLRQLVHPIMHMVQSEEVDVGNYISNVLTDSQISKKRGVKNIEVYAQNHAKFLRNYLKKNRSRTKSHYIVLEVQDPRYKRVGHNPTQSLSKKLSLKFNRFISEFNPSGFLAEQELFVTPRNYVQIDTAGKRMIFKSSHIVPLVAPQKSRKIGQILQFDSLVPLLRFAKLQKKNYYYGEIDLDYLLKTEFRDLSLKQREEEFSIEERRLHVAICAGKTRWAFDEVEKHLAVISDKLEATGLRVQRVNASHLLSGKFGLTSANKIKVTPHYLRADNNYMSVIQATGYPYQVGLGWLSNIVDGREDYDFTMYIYPIGINEALSTFRNAILKLSTEKKARSDFLDPETEQHLGDVTNFYTQVVSGKEKYFQASLYITAKANSVKQLDTVLEKCKSDLAGASIDFQTSDYDVARAVYSTRLSGNDLLNKKREFPSSSLAATFPHISSSIEIEPSGMFFAFDWMSAPIIFDLKSLPNQHISILGESGSGKSYFAKSLIPRYIMGGYQVFITDPDGEYCAIAKEFSGTVSTVGPSKGNCINPFDLGDSDVNSKIRSLLGLLSIITGQLSKYQESIIGDALIELYDNKKNSQATMSDFAKILQKRQNSSKDQQIRHDIQFLLISIKPFLRGNIYGFVDKPTNVKIEGQMHVFDLSEYKNDKTLKDFFNYIIFDFISSRLLHDTRPKALFMDEGWTMVNYKGSEDYVRYIIKDSRKYNVSFVFITQELEDMLSSDAGRSILNNTSTQFIFHHKESAMPLMKKTLNLTDVEYERLIAVAKGEGLLISDKHRLFFKVQTSKKEHEMISTDPNRKIQPDEQIPLKDVQKQFLSSALKNALEDTSTIAKSIGIEKEHNTLQEKDLIRLPIALTHGLVSDEEKLALLKPLSIDKQKRSKNSSGSLITKKKIELLKPFTLSKSKKKRSDPKRKKSKKNSKGG